MSFSSDVKKELIVITPKARHCQTAELSAMKFSPSAYTEKTEVMRKSAAAASHADILDADAADGQDRGDGRDGAGFVDNVAVETMRLLDAAG